MGVFDWTYATMYTQLAPQANNKKYLLIGSLCLNAVLAVVLLSAAFSGNSLASAQVASRRGVMTGAASVMGGLAATKMARAVNPTSNFETNCGACHQGGGNNIIEGHTLSKTAMEQYLDGGWNEEEIKAMTDWVYEQSTGAFKDIN